MPEDPETTSLLTENTDIKLFIKNYLSNLEIPDIMVHRSDLIYVEISESYESIAKKFNQSNSSMLLVCDKNLDNIKGYIHIKDYIISQDISSIIKTPIIAPLSMGVNTLIDTMNASGNELAIVIDEFSGTDGVIILQDVYAYIFSNASVEKSKAKNPDKSIFNAREKIEDIESILGIKLRGSESEDEYTTIAGMIMNKTNSVPQKGSKIYLENRVMAEVLDSNSRKIKKVKLIQY